MRGLHSSADWASLLANSAAGAAERSRAVDILGPEMVAWAVETAVRVVADVTASVSELPTMVTGRERQGCEECILSTLIALFVNADPQHMLAPAGAIDNARAAVRQGVGVGAVLQTVWVSHTLVQDALLAVMQDELRAVEFVDAVREINARMFAYANVYIRDLSNAYDDEQRLWNGRIPALRRSVLDVIVAGDTPPPDAESILGIRLTGTHLIAFAWATPGSFVPDREAEMQRILSDIAAATNAHGSIAIGFDEVTVLWWRYSGDAPHHVDKIISAVPRPSWMRLALGPAGQGQAGVRTGYRCAQDLRALAGHSDVRRFWAFRDNGFSALLALNREAAQRFARIEIAPLLGPDPRLRELRETLRLYLKSGRSRAAAASRLNIAPNTVAARVRRASELLGHEIDDRSFELLVALESATLDDAS
ncbi:PucR family transcriptional regulator [Subtercola endophyticus]|uniref:PucR family transcriptional regulator n=1 Tax=Subtercola endophyticus TaxID=2895559 RepID=UPI001E2CBA38|nr:PucR family transcriptional regulator [Subtercola endophyticus]UFS59794.1 helix-turn-helix domain-containing protein [Subtercola endophyticus]